MELERHQADVHAALGQANHDLRQAAVWSASADSMRSSWVVLPVFGVLVVALVIGSFGLQAAAAAELVDRNVIPVLSSVMVFGVMIVTIAVSGFVAVRARRPPKTASAGATRVACPSCGAPNLLAAGQGLETCRFCRAALMPSQTVMQRAVDVARAQRRAAEVQRHRAERRGMVAAMGRTGANATPYIVLGSFLPMTIGSTVVMAGQLLFGDRPPPLAGIAVLGGIASLNVSLIALVYAWRSHRRQRIASALADLTRQLGGDPLPGLPGVALWLDAYWAAPYELRYLAAGPYHAAARLTPGGFAALVDVDPVSSMARHYPPRVHLLVAASMPDDAATRSSPEVGASRQWLERAGFAVTIAPTGVLARAEGRTLAHLRKNPEALHVLAAVLTTLVGLTRALGGEPVGPAP